METKEIFSRTAANSPGQEIRAGLYNLTIGMVLCWGFFVNWWMVANIPAETFLAVNLWVFFIGYFVSCFAGIYLFTKSTTPIVSFLGYNLVVLPFGMVVNIVVSQYEPGLVVDAMRVTGLVTAIMMVLGSMYPAFFQKIRGALTVALIAVIVVEFVDIFFLKKNFEFIDWIVVTIFCGYIGYDWGRANAIPKTLDNAIDSAAALYMDIINLFLRILRIMGRKR